MGTKFDLGGTIDGREGNCYLNALCSGLRTPRLAGSKDPCPYPAQLARHILEKLLSLPADQIKPGSRVVNLYVSAAQRGSHPDGLMHLIDTQGSVLKGKNILHFKERPKGKPMIEYLLVHPTPEKTTGDKAPCLLTLAADIQNPSNYHSQAKNSGVIAVITLQGDIPGITHTEYFCLPEKDKTHLQIIKFLGNNTQSGNIEVEVQPASSWHLLNEIPVENCFIGEAEISAACERIASLALKARCLGLEGMTVGKLRDQQCCQVYKMLGSQAVQHIPPPPRIDELRKSELKSRIFPAMTKASLKTLEEVHEALHPFRTFCDQWLIDEYLAQKPGPD